MKSDIPDELFVFSDSPSLGPNCVLLSSEADSSSIGLPNSLDFDSCKSQDYFLSVLPWSSDKFSIDDLPF